MRFRRSRDRDGVDGEDCLEVCCGRRRRESGAAGSTGEVEEGIVTRRVSVRWEDRSGRRTQEKGRHVGDGCLESRGIVGVAVAAGVGDQRGHIVVGPLGREALTELERIDCPRWRCE